MSFKSVVDYNEERYGNFFMLRNDNDFADVIFLYQNTRDVLVADVHYIKSPEYSGYVHCCGKGCPACGKGIRVQNKLFIPLFNISTQKIEFFDRSTKFENQLMSDVFDKYPNPSEFVFRITRHGEAGSQDTRYQIQAIAKNSTMPYAKILADHNATLPDYYSVVCKDLTPSELQGMLSTGDSAPTSEYNYVPTPRANSGAASVVVPDDIPEYTTPTVATTAVNSDNAVPAMPVPEGAPWDGPATSETVDENVDF